MVSTSSTLFHDVTVPHVCSERHACIENGKETKKGQRAGESKGGTGAREEEDREGEREAERKGGVEAGRKEGNEEAPMGSEKEKSISNVPRERERERE